MTVDGDEDEDEEDAESSDADDEEAAAMRRAAAVEREKTTMAQWVALRPEFVLLALEAATELRHGHLSGLPGADVIQMACTCSCCLHCGSTVFIWARNVEVDFVTARGTVPIIVPVYNCKKCQKGFHRHPISVGAFPATPVRAVDLSTVGAGERPVWLETRLLELYFQQQVCCPQMSEEGFCKSVHVMPGTPAAARLQGYFKDVLSEWLRFRETLADTATLGCTDDPLSKGLFGCCGACAEAGPEKPLHSIHFDGVFKLKTFAFAARVKNATSPDAAISGCRVVPATEPAADAAPLFPEAPEVTSTRTFCEDLQSFMSGKSTTEPGANHCANMKAAAEDSKGKVHLSERGLFGAMCSHGFFILGGIMDLGERYAFAILLLKLIAKVQKCKVQYAWYDIGCRFGPYLKRWLAELAAEGTEAEVLRCLLDTACPLPPFHELCHVLSCRASYSSRNFVGAGTGVGDLCEGCWAWLGLFGGRWSRMSRDKKLAILSANLAEWNRSKDVRARARTPPPSSTLPRPGIDGAVHDSPVERALICSTEIRHSQSF
jgi:hypothetical protein